MGLLETPPPWHATIYFLEFLLLGDYDETFGQFIIASSVNVGVNNFVQCANAKSETIFEARSAVLCTHIWSALNSVPESRS